MEQAVAVTVAIFVAGVIFTLGRYSVRIEQLEKWREEQRQAHADMGEQLAAIRQELGRLTGS